jgi:hypothetical protein
VHHLAKHFEGPVFRSLRGAGAIDGWTEWAMAVSLTNPEELPGEWIRKIEFENKAATTANPVYFRIKSGASVMSLDWLQSDRMRGVIEP